MGSEEITIKLNDEVLSLLDLNSSDILNYESEENEMVGELYE